MSSTSTLKRDRVIYWFSTSIVLFAMAWAVVTYYLPVIPNTPDFFAVFGYPSYFKYPVSFLKLIAIIVIVSNYYNNLKEMVYVAYLINLGLAIYGHLNGGPGVEPSQPYHAYIITPALALSYLFSNRVRGKPQRDFLGFFTDPK